MSSDRLDEARRRRWTAHCRSMAAASHALADWCEDPEMIRRYIELAARWLEMANSPTRELPDNAGQGPILLRRR